MHLKIKQVLIIYVKILIISWDMGDCLSEQQWMEIKFYNYYNKMVLSIKFLRKFKYIEKIKKTEDYIIV